MEVEYIQVGNLKPYEKNARKHEEYDISAIAESIKTFGFRDPIGVWSEQNIIVEGHGRYEAAKKLGMNEVPCIRLDDMTDEQRRAYGLAHNKTAELSEWDIDLLNGELDTLLDFNMEDFGFDLHLDDDPVVKDTKVLDPSCQHNVFENQELKQYPTNSFYGMPNIKATHTVGDKMLRFMDWKEVKDPENYIAHFFYDDYKFINAWREPEKYIEKLKMFKAVMSPNFSVYTDFPRALQILACYRRQWCGAFWNDNGIDVIPNVVWGDKDSYEYCFDGIPKHSTVVISTLGKKIDPMWNGTEGNLFLDGYNEMMKRLEPTAILAYGNPYEGLEGNVTFIKPYYREKFG